MLPMQSVFVTNAWLITCVACQMIGHNYMILLLPSNIQKQHISNNFASDVLIVHVLSTML